MSLSSGAWPPLMRTAFAPIGKNGPCLAFHLVAVCGQFAAGQPGCLVQVWGNEISQGKESGFERFNGIIRNQRIAAGGHHHRINHDVCCVPLFQASRDCLDDSGDVASMPILTAFTSRSEKTASIWAADEIRGHIMNAGYAKRVLCGQGRYDGGPIGMVGREALDVGLNAGAAAGVRAGNGQRYRYRCSSVFPSLGFDRLAQVPGCCGHVFGLEQFRDDRNAIGACCQ